MERISVDQVRKAIPNKSDVDEIVTHYEYKVGRDITKYDSYTVLTDYLNKYEYCGELDFNSIDNWLFKEVPDKVRYISPDLLQNIHDEKEIIELLFAKNPNLSRSEKDSKKMLANILNHYHYEGELTSDAIRYWINNLEQKKSYSLLKKEIREISKHLQTNFDKELNEEATEFVEKHGMKRILDESLTGLPCIMLIDEPEITEDPLFLHELYRQGYSKKNQEVIKNYDLFDVYYINHITNIEKLYEQLDRIYRVVRKSLEKRFLSFNIGFFNI